VLYLGSALPADKVFAAVGHYWIGDALGMITVIPAMTSMFIYLSVPRNSIPAGVGHRSGTPGSPQSSCASFILLD
jgi:hypothetical protein